jgi:hypothetical protein
MNRRDFIVSRRWSGGCVARLENVDSVCQCFAGAMAQSSYSERGPTERTFHILGVPLRTGSLYPGNENDAPALSRCAIARTLASGRLQSIR